MASWTAKSTKAHAHVRSSLKVVDGLLSYMTGKQGKPTAKERALFAAAVVFTYGIWENYVEQLAIELAHHVAEKINPERVSDRVRKLLEKGTVWELAVSPGWRHLWVQKVEMNAVGDDDEKFGLNTAKSGQVKALLELAGAGDPFAGLSSTIVMPEHLGASPPEASEAINRLVELRGEIVHTGAVPASLRKNHVRAWRQFVEDITREVDKNCRTQCAQLLR